MSARRFKPVDFERCVEFYLQGADAHADPEMGLWLQANPALARRAREHAEMQRQLRQRYDPVLDEPVPPRLLAGGRRVSVRWPIRFGFAATLVLAAGLVWWLQTTHSGTPPVPMFSQRVATVAQNRQAPPVERPVSQIRPTATASIHHPDLSLRGYSLRSRHVVPGGAEPVVEFLYSNRQGVRVRIYAQVRHPQPTHAPQVVTENGVSLAQWQHDGVNYALVGDLPRQSLARLAQTAASSTSHQPSSGLPLEALSAKSSSGVPAQLPQTGGQAVISVASPAQQGGM